MHPRFLHVVTSGVERDIIVHNATASSPCLQNLTVTPTEVRRRSDGGRTDWFAEAVAGPHLTMRDELDESESPIIEVFDK
jgi:WD repeat-containing protein 22